MADTKKLDEALKKDTQAAQSPQQPSYTQQLQQMVSTGYTPSETVTSANNYLQQVIANKPGSYQSAYTDQLQSLYEQISNRGKFIYDMNADALYQQYKQQYQQMGKAAMQDAMGQAAALTGGYGSSYAATAGNQAYQSYLQRLNEQVPQFAQMAFDQYQAEGDALNQRYAMTQAMDETAYGRWLDSYNVWNSERNYAQSAADSAYNRDYAQYADRLNAYGALADIERANAESDREYAYREAESAKEYAYKEAASAKEYAYNTAMSMLQNGLMPSDDILSSAGINHADALAMAEKFSKKSSGSSGSSSSSGNTATQPVSQTATNVLNSLREKIDSAVNKKETVKSNAEDKRSIFDSLRKKFTK